MAASTMATSRETRHHELISRGLFGLQRNSKYTDFTIETTDHKQIPCHRVVMAAVSPYFDTMFDSDMIEAQSQSVKLPFPYETLVDVLEYIYTGHDIVTTKNSDAIPNIYYLAHYFQISSLVTECEDFLGHGMKPNISLDIWVTAKLCGNTKIAEIAKVIVLTNFELFCDVENIGSISLNNLKELLGDQYLNSSSIMKCKAAWVWLAAQQEADLQVVEQLLKALTSSENVASDDILNAMSSDDNLKVSDDIIQTNRLNWDLACQKLFIKKQESGTYVRNPELREHVTFIASGGAPFKENHVLLFNLKEKSWYDLESQQCDLGHRFAICTVENTCMMFISGGTNSKQFLYYDPETKCWVSYTDLPVGREYHSMCSTNKFIYILAGNSRDSSDKLWNVDRYDTKKNIWETAGQIVQPVAAACLAVVGPKLYLLGGLLKENSSTSPCDVIQCYDTQTKFGYKLDLKLPFKSKFQITATATINDKVYVLNKGKIYKLNVLSKKPVPPELVCEIENPPVKGFAAIAFGDKILIVGGEDENFKGSTRVLQFDTSGGQVVVIPVKTPFEMKDFVFTKIMVPLSWNLLEIRNGNQAV